MVSVESENRQKRADRVIAKLGSSWVSCIDLAKMAGLSIKTMSTYLGRAVRNDVVERKRVLNGFGDYMTIFRRKNAKVVFDVQEGDFIDVETKVKK